MAFKPKITPEIKQRIQEQYLKDKLTQAQLAECYQVNVNTIRKVVRGLAQQRRKFTAEQIHAIRASPLSSYRLAKDLGYKHGEIQSIRAYKAYKDV